jgi:hypothetical protein
VTRALVEFFAPPRKLAQSALSSAAATTVLLLLQAPLTFITPLAALVGWVTSRSRFDLAIQPIRDWDRAWPVTSDVLFRTRVQASWLACWAPLVASWVVASAFAASGAVTPAAWVRLAIELSCVIGLVPFLTSVTYRFEPRVEVAGSVVAALLVFAGVNVSILVGLLKGGSLSEPVEVLPFAIGAFCAGVAGLLLARAWVKVLPTALAPAQSRAIVKPVAGASVRAAGLSRPKLRWAVVRFFYLHPGNRATWMAWLLLIPGLVFSLHEFPIVFCFILPGLLIGYAGLNQPAALPAHLPVPRDRILAYLLAPLGLFVVVGLSLEQWSPLFPVRALDTSVYYADWRYDTDPPEQRHAQLRLVVPAYSWRATWGEPPLVTTPEGVSRRPTAYPVLSNLPLNVYNPYDARLDDDPELVRYQVSRALQEHRGVDVSPADVERACVDETGQRRPLVVCLRQELESRSRVPLVWAATKLWFVAACIYCLFQSGINGVRRQNVWRRLLDPAALGFLLLIFTLWTMTHLNAKDPTGTFGFAFRLAALLNEVTHFFMRGPLLAGAFGALTLVLMYRHVARSYRSVETFSGRASSQR